jgi:hypothetical protein
MAIFNYFLGVDIGYDFFLFSKGVFKKGAEMKKKFILGLIIFLGLNITGCAPIIIGAAIGGVSVYAVGKDTIQGNTDKPYDSLWGAAFRVSQARGTIKHQNPQAGYIELQQVDSSQIWIRLIRLTQATTRMKISARKYHLPNLNLAQDIFAKIIEEAK